MRIFTVGGDCNVLTAILLAPVVQRPDNSFQWIKCTPTNPFYPPDSDLSAG